MFKKTLKLAAAATLAVVAVSVAGEARAAPYPDHAITFIIPYGPGGTVDPTGRILGEAASTLLGQPVVIENKAGAAGSLGTDIAVRAPADGYTVLIHTNLVASELWLKKDLPYKFLESMTPIIAINQTPFVLLVNPTLPVKTVKELVDYAKKNPGKLNFGASGVGSSGHLRGEQFKVETGVDMAFIPYIDGGATLAGLVSNEVQVAFDTLPGSIGMIRDGRLRLLAVSTPERWFLVPETPTMKEAGYPGLVSQWIGAYVRSGTPPDIIKKLETTFQQALKDPKLLEAYKKIGFATIGTGQQETLVRLKDETEMWRKTIAAAGIKLN